MTNPLPDLPPDEYDALLLDIEQRGIVYPIIRDQAGNTVDGHQRERIAQTLGIEPPVKVVQVADEAERLALAIALNAYRRQLTPAQRREAILRLAPTGMTQAEIGRAVGVHASTVNRVLASEPGIADAIPLDEAVALDRQGRLTGERGGRPRSDPRDRHWSSLDGLVKSLRGLSDSTPAEVAASVPEHRRAGTAKNLRRLGTYLGSIALELEGMTS